jgi:putative endonuclease
MEQNSQKHLKTGQIGEDLAVQYLKDEDFKVLDRNYWKPYGEIDIVAIKAGNVHFVEVKTVTRDHFDACPNKFLPEQKLGRVNRGTFDDYEPEDNLHLWKRQRLGRVVMVYLSEKGMGEDSDWQVDLLSVYVNSEGKLLKIEVLEDIILT